MDSIVNKFKHAFQSERLFYRAIENTAPDKDFFWEHLSSDPVIRGLASPSLLRPDTKARSDEDVEGMVKNTLLSVMICLPPKDTAVKTKVQASTTSIEDATSDSKPSPIGFIVLSKQPTDVTVHWRWTRLSIALAEPFQGNGYGPEAINWALDWAFTWAGMHKVELGTVSYNTRAAGVYRKLGFKQEGIRRGVIFMDRKWYDLIEFGLLEEEWESLRGNKGRDKNEGDYLVL